MKDRPTFEPTHKVQRKRRWLLLQIIGDWDEKGGASFWDSEQRMRYFMKDVAKPIVKRKKRNNARG